MRLLAKQRYYTDSNNWTFSDSSKFENATDVQKLSNSYLLLLH